MGVGDKLRARYALVASLALAGCAGSHTCELVHVTDLKLIRRAHTFYTKMTIDGQDERVLLNTGGVATLISETAAHRVGMNVHSAWGYIVGLGGPVNVGVLPPHEVRLGEAPGETLPIGTVADTVLPDGADGILGMSLLRDYDMDLNFWGNRVGLYKPLSGCTAPRAALTGPLYSVDLVNPPGDPRPIIRVSINGTDLRALISTDTPQSLIFRDSARLAGVSGGALLDSRKLSVLGPRPVKGDARISGPLQVGDLTVSNMKLVVVDERHAGFVNMTLGYDFITTVHLWISHSSRSVIMQFPPQASPAAIGKS
jgi:hypothetical protein